MKEYMRKKRELDRLQKQVDAVNASTDPLRKAMAAVGNEIIQELKAKLPKERK